MKIVLASTNKAKIAATEKVFSNLYNNISITPVDVESDVSKTPDTDDEGIQGCLNRINNSKKEISDGDMYVGLEGIITKNNFGVFICGWAVVEIVGENKNGIGCSAKVQIPNFIAENIQTFGELSKLVIEKYPSNLIGQMEEIGTNGVITEKMYTRVNEFENALKCALGYAHNQTNH